jgi:hypothetical protein
MFLLPMVRSVVQLSFVLRLFFPDRFAGWKLLFQSPKHKPNRSVQLRGEPLFGCFSDQTHRDRTKPVLLFLFSAIQLPHIPISGPSTMSSPNLRSPSEREGAEAIIKSILYHDLVEKRLVPPRSWGFLSSNAIPKTGIGISKKLTFRNMVPMQISRHGGAKTSI